MKQTTITPYRDVNGCVTGYTAYEYEDDTASSGSGLGISDAISDGIAFATVIIILAVLLLPLSPIWFVMTRAKIKSIKNEGKSPNRLLETANIITKITFILQIISFVIFVILFVCSIIFMPQIVSFIN